MIRVFTAFSGYDSQCMALDRLTQDFPQFGYELVGWSEIDRHAIKAHDAVYPQWSGRNYGDISKIDWSQVPDFDLFTYSFPCQSVSSAGKQHGLSKGSGTRSSLLWECERAIAIKKPMYLLMENVSALLQAQFLPDFHKWQELLSGLGYNNHVAVLNAKDFGIPQNRERVFMVSVLSDEPYYFPDGFPLEECLRDVMEEDVDESYFLSEKQVHTIVSHCERKVAEGCGFKVNFQTPDGISGTVLTRIGSRACDTFLKLEPRVMQVGNLVEESNFSNPQRGRVYSASGLAPACCANSGGNLEPKVMMSVNPSGRKLEFKGTDSIKPVSPTLRATDYKCPPVVYKGYCIRKLTPRECFRLMDVSESDIDRISASGISRSQQYKLAGNSIVVACLYHIFRTLFIDTKPQKLTQLQLF